jgi:repressor LexA
MRKITRRQNQILDYIQKCQQKDGITPSMRDIAAHFGFRSPRTVTDHVEALRKKGALVSEPGLARTLRVVSPLQAFRKRVVDIPVFGTVPAGFAENRYQEAQGCVSIDVGTLNIKPTARTFALQVTGDSMIGKNICAGDVVVLEHGLEAKAGDVVAALIDNESTLKTFVKERGKSYLRAENPKYPKLIPADELVIQGVMIALIRRCSSK